MDRNFLESLMAKVQNPAKVCVKFYDNQFYYIESAEGTNNTLDWYAINSSVIEDELEKEGYTWYYVFETAPEQSPVIYMFFGKELSWETLEEVLNDIEKSLPEDREVFIENASFSTIDVDQYDNSISVLEEELCRKAYEVFTTYKA